MIDDISPDFKPSRLDSEIIAKILPHAKTGKAIRVFNNVHRPLSDYGYWFTLSALWVDYTGWSELELWKRLFRSPRPNRETSIMKPSELTAFRNLPEELRVYRAHRTGESDWISFTLSLERAVMFARLRKVNVIHEYRMPKASALCLFLRRGEDEVLTLEKEAASPVREFEIVAV